MPTTATPAAAASVLRVNREAAPKPVVNLAELNIVTTSFRRGYRPGCCTRTLLAGIVAAGSVAGLDLSQEADYAAPRLLGAAPSALAAPMVASR